MTPRIFRFASAVASAALLSLLIPGAAAQKQPASSAPGVSSALGDITLPVTVVDDHGRPVKNLTASNLSLTDGGRKQTIQSFGPDPNLQMTFGIVAEAGSDINSELGDERLSTIHFVDHTLPGVSDKGFVIQYNHEVDLLANPTAKADTLHDAINQIGAPKYGGDGGRSDGGTLYDAIYLASKEVIDNQPGRRVLILFTDGIDHGSKESLENAVAAAQSAHAAIFAVYIRAAQPRSHRERAAGNPGGVGYPGGGYPGGGYPGGGYPGRRYPGGYPGGPTGPTGGQAPRQEPPERAPGVDGRKILEQICNATGGYMVEARPDKADKAYDKIVALLQHPYRITWKPDAKTANISYHRLSLSTDKKNVWAIMQTGLTTGLQ